MSDSDDVFFDDLALAEVDRVTDLFMENGHVVPNIVTTQLSHPPRVLQQRNLFGQIVSAPPVRTQVLTPPTPRQTQLPVAIARKIWDRSLFLKRGWNTPAKSKKVKKKHFVHEVYSDESEDSDAVDNEDEEIEHQTSDIVLDLSQPPPPLKLQLNRDEIQTWVYPINKPLRDYQYNISQKCLLTNVLVSLPTGLGKTFIAAVVILNFHRWFPEGKIIFMAPNRVLVRQQIEACHHIAGVPASKAVVMTGHDPASQRRTAWKEKKIIYATPQVVVNDMKSGALNPMDVICIIVDEAHRATGEYDYCKVVRYMMATNPNHRIVALTATPGSNSDAVQAVVDNLHIGHIELRTDESIDTRPYLHDKVVDIQVVPLTTDVEFLRDKVARLMGESGLRQLAAERILYTSDPLNLPPFAVLAAQKKLTVPQRRHFPNLKSVHKLASSLAYLLEHSITEFENHMNELKGGPLKNPLYKEIMDKVKLLKSQPNYLPHPKMDVMRTHILQHLVSVDDTGGRSRIIVFCEYRNVVEEIVNYLAKDRPTIRAVKFIGQGATKSGVKGFKQKTQLETLKKFKHGEYNVLVATSVAEEGLDIGDVDVIINYDVKSSPTRMLQRVGRTGRARKGRVILLVTAGREERNWGKAKSTYEGVQNAIQSKTAIELYADCERLVPNDIKPQSVEKHVPIETFDISTISVGTRYTRAPPKPPKDKNRNIPKNAVTTFRKASELQKSKTKVSQQNLDGFIKGDDGLPTAKQFEETKKQWMRSKIGYTSPLNLDFSDTILDDLPEMTEIGFGFSKLRSRTRKCFDEMDKFGSAQYLQEWKEKCQTTLDSTTGVPKIKNILDKRDYEPIKRKPTILILESEGVPSSSYIRSARTESNRTISTPGSNKSNSQSRRQFKLQHFEPQIRLSSKEAESQTFEIIDLVTSDESDVEASPLLERKDGNNTIGDICDNDTGNYDLDTSVKTITGSAERPSTFSSWLDQVTPTCFLEAETKDRNECDANGNEDMNLMAPISSLPSPLKFTQSPTLRKFTEASKQIQSSPPGPLSAVLLQNDKDVSRCKNVCSSPPASSSDFGEDIVLDDDALNAIDKIAQDNNSFSRIDEKEKTQTKKQEDFEIKAVESDTSEVSDIDVNLDYMPPPPPTTVRELHDDQLPSVPESPCLTQAILGPGNRKRMFQEAVSTEDDESQETSRTMLKRLRKAGPNTIPNANATTEPRKRTKKRERRKKLDVRNNPIFDIEAERSGNGSSEMEDEEPENSSDQRFLDDDGDGGSGGINAVYRNSLLSQNPISKLFKRTPVRPGQSRRWYGGPEQVDNDALASRAVAGHQVLDTPETPKSSNAPENSQWDYGSFIVPDEEDIVYDSQSDGLCGTSQ